MVDFGPKQVIGIGKSGGFDARMAKLADALASGASDRKVMGVQVPLRARNKDTFKLGPDCFLIGTKSRRFMAGSPFVHNKFFESIQKGGRALRIACPKCELEPKAVDRWCCSPGCGHVWNTFDTIGRCPQCGKQWKETVCLHARNGVHTLTGIMTFQICITMKTNSLNLS